MTAFDGTTPVLPDADMRAIGFTDRAADRWYFCQRVGLDTTVNFTIVKDSGEYTESVMDECFGQHAFYGRMKPEYGIPIRDNVEQVVSALNASGLTLTVDHRAYGCTK